MMKASEREYPAEWITSTLMKRGSYHFREGKYPLMTGHLLAHPAVIAGKEQGLALFLVSLAQE
jgi:hypothetical protein